MAKATETRLNILQKAFEIIYTKSYQTTSIDEIIATTKVTKGAFYYHFKTKDEMGLAIINEIVTPAMTNAFIKPLQNVDNPIDAIYKLIENLLLNNVFLKLEYGCPAGNLTNEMTPWNKEFSQSLSELIHKWQETMTQCIEDGKQNRSINKNIDAKQVTFFVMSGYWGIRNFGKVYNSKDCYYLYLKELKIYLNNLK